VLALAEQDKAPMNRKVLLLSTSFDHAKLRRGSVELVVAAIGVTLLNDLNALSGAAQKVRSVYGDIVLRHCKDEMLPVLRMPATYGPFHRVLRNIVCFQ